MIILKSGGNCKIRLKAPYVFIWCVNNSFKVILQCYTGTEDLAGNFFLLRKGAKHEVVFCPAAEIRDYGMKS